jgi:hypothetical protein
VLGLFHGAYPDHTLHPNGTIAQLGERAIEVRKVAGSIPARPIIFDGFFGTFYQDHHTHYHLR